MSLKKLVTQSIVSLAICVIFGYAILYILSIDNFVDNELGASPSSTPLTETAIIAFLALSYIASLAWAIHKYLSQNSSRVLPIVPPLLTVPSLYISESQKPSAPIIETVTGSPSESYDAQKFVFCPNCGKELPIAKKFCPFCGSNFATGASAPTAQVSGIEAQLQPVSTINVTPTKQPHFVSHGVPLTLIYIMMQRRKINVKLNARFGKYKIEFTDDNFVLTPEMIPPEIAEATRRWDESTAINWLAPHIPRTLEKGRITQGPPTQSSQTATPFVFSTSSSQMSETQPAAQASLTAATLNVYPTEPPRGLSHMPAINCVVQMLLKHKIATKFRLGHHPPFTFYNVRIADDDLMVTPERIPPHIAEAAKKWDETKVINWLAPFIPRAIEKAKANPQAGISAR